MQFTIILPTYNESENIEDLLRAVYRELGQIPHKSSVLVVDDNSPDGTAEIVEQLQQQLPNLSLLLGEKEGLGSAYIRGMKYALDVLGAEAIFEMDADFSHDPKDIRRLLVNVEYGADFVIGSRYVPGGTIPAEWGILRRTNSAVGNFVARNIAGMQSIRDCTAGFRCIGSRVLRNIDLDGLNVQGYAFQVALLHAAISQGASVIEVPVNFVDRSRGVSKLGLKDIFEFIVNAWWIRFNASRTFIKFAIVGVSGVVVNLAAFSLLLHLGINKFIASPIAIETSIVWNFLLNNFWTFRWRSTEDGTHAKGLKFNIVSIAALLISYSTFVVLSLMFPNTSPQIHQLVGILPATMVNYFLNSYWTFRER